VVVADEGGVAINPAEEAGISETNNLANHVAISKAIDDMLNGIAPAYESPRFKSFVTHCSSHVAETCSGNDPMHHSGVIDGPSGLALCLFDSMEGCLVDHKASLYQPKPKPNPQNSVQYMPLLMQTVKFQTVLRTCSHVTAQTCLTASTVDATCLVPSLNQCVYPTQVEPPPGTTSLLS